MLFRSQASLAFVSKNEKIKRIKLVRGGGGGGGGEGEGEDGAQLSNKRRKTTAMQCLVAPQNLGTGSERTQRLSAIVSRTAMMAGQPLLLPSKPSFCVKERENKEDQARAFENWKEQCNISKLPSSLRSCRAKTTH